MDSVETSANDKVDKLEGLFLGWLGQAIPPVEELFGCIKSVQVIGALKRAEEWSEMFQEALATKGDVENSIRLLSLRSEWLLNDKDSRRKVEAAAARLSKERLWTTIVACCGLDADVPVRECVRRLQALSKLKSGVMVFDKTWGFGVVRRMDDFYRKVAIDFTRKPGHEMSFAYAGETLDLVNDDHILAKKYKDPEGVKLMTRENPAELIRMVLRSYGPRSVPELKDFFGMEGLVSDADWKGFWDAARKALKADPLIEIPTKRTEPVRILQKQKGYDLEWFTQFAVEKDIEKIITRIDGLIVDMEPAELSDNNRNVLSQRIAFAIRGIENRKFDLVARLVMNSGRLGLDGQVAGIQAARMSLLGDAGFLDAVRKLPARELKSFLEYAFAVDEARATDLFISVLTETSINVLVEMMVLLCGHGAEQRVIEILKALVSEKRSGPVVILWLGKNLDKFKAWQITTMHDLLSQMVDCIETPFSGDRLRAQHQIKDLFAQITWLEVALKYVDAAQIEAVVRRINNARGWDSAERRSVLAKMLKLHKDVAAVLTSIDEVPEATGPQRFTSWRSQRERGEQLKKLVEVEIPANSRDIAHARSYGDLSENHEYKSAKEHQAILMRKQAGLEEDLKVVQGTDFEGFPTDKAGMGTGVSVRRPSGKVQTFYILGEWDRDEALGIVSVKSRVGETLVGCEPATKVLLPGDNGEDELCDVERIVGLSDEIKAWIRQQ